ncbi:MAG TPA: hypothetical protein VHH32_06445 [Gemmatimonadales bacterium]|nr:hypothetical protein [Gemmatimonadales bacterium]
MTRTVRQFGAFAAIVLTQATGCATNQADTTPDVALSESTEGIPAEPRTPGKSPRMSGDTLICETSRKYSTADGDRWLWVRIFIERNPDDDTDKTTAETLVSIDAQGQEYDQKVALAGVSVDGDKDHTLRNTTGVRTASTNESPKQAHRARGYTVGPNMGPIAVRCGGR